jgi:hypothetical protein
VTSAAGPRKDASHNDPVRFSTCSNVRLDASSQYPIAQALGRCAMARTADEFEMDMIGMKSAYGRC